MNLRGGLRRIGVAIRGVCPVAVAVALAGFASAGETAADGDAPAFVPVSDAILENPDPADWLSWRRTTNGHGYSPLEQITRDNVASLRMVWTRALREGSQSGTPLVYDGVLYMPNPADVMQAMDAVTGDLLWEHVRPVAPEIRNSVYWPLGSNNRNVAIYGNLIIDTSSDAHVFALDARTGRPVWETPILEHGNGDYIIQGAGPIIARGKAVSGRSCAPEAGPDACVITAHDALTGAEVWRRRTVPGPGEPGDETWGDVPFEERVHVGSWMPPSYDPELNLVLAGTSVTAPAPKFMLDGIDKDYLYHNSTLALDGDTGEIRWYYQHMRDHWDLDHPFERLLVDTVVAPDPDAVRWLNPDLVPGEKRKVMTGIPGKTGIVYTLDRATGEFLWATPTISQNVVFDIDGATGAVSENEDFVFTEMGQMHFICPSTIGGRDWEAGAYSPLTNAMYVPMRNVCMPTMATDSPDASLALYGLAVDYVLAPGKEAQGAVYAVSAETGRILWVHEQRASTMSLVTTGGGLVFGGDLNGRFKAFDQRTGEVLWEINLGSPVTGFPISYAVDGRQYVAVSTGHSGISSLLLRMTRELRPSAGNNLFVFALPE